jgi:hypothetical protein
MGIINAVSEIAGKCRVWSHAKVERKCLEVGHELVQVAKANDGKLTIDQLNAVYRRILPKGVKLQAVSDPKEGEAILRSFKALKEDTISLYLREGAAFVVKDPKGEVLFYIPIENFIGDKAVNVATHEFEHALNRKMTLRQKMQTVRYKIFGEERVKKEVTADFDDNNKKSILIQKWLCCRLIKGLSTQSVDTKGLWKHLGLESKDEMNSNLVETIRKVLDPQSEPKNIRFLKAIRRTFKDEARAYRVGGKAAREYLGLQESGTASEVASELYGATADAMTQEIRAQRIKRLRRLFGINVKDYEGVTSSTFTVRVLSEDEGKDAIADLTNTMSAATRQAVPMQSQGSFKKINLEG